MADKFDNIADLDIEGIEALLAEERRRKKDSQKERSRKPEKSEKRRSKTRSRSNSKRRDKHRERDRDRDSYRRSRSRNRQERKKRDSRSPSRKRHRSRSRGKYERSERNDRNLSRERERSDKEQRIIDKQIEEAKRQAVEAQRDDCTALVLRLHLKCKERDIFTFFAKANIGRVVDIKIIRDQRSGKSKGVSYVEFENQESVLLAVSLTGQQILGQTVIIQSSQAEKNRAAAAAKYKKEMLKEQQKIHTQGYDSLEVDGPMRIFVGGLTQQLDEMTDNDLRQLFPFGEIDFIDLDKDEHTGKCRGYAYIQFRRASDARVAIKEMNGFNYNGKILKVGEITSDSHNGRASFINSEDLVDESNLIHNVQSRQTLMQKLNRDNVPALVSGGGIGMTPVAYPYNKGVTPLPNSNPLMTPYDMMSSNINPMMMPKMPFNGQTPYSIQTHCILLSNLFDKNSVDLKNEPEFFFDIEEDVRNECSDCGEIEKIFVDKNSKDGNVWVKFAQRNVEASVRAIEKLNGRFFAKKQITVKYVPESVFDANYFK